MSTVLQNEKYCLFYIFYNNPKDVTEKNISDLHTLLISGGFKYYNFIRNVTMFEDGDFKLFEKIVHDFSEKIDVLNPFVFRKLTTDSYFTDKEITVESAFIYEKHEDLFNTLIDEISSQIDEHPMIDINAIYKSITRKNINDKCSLPYPNRPDYPCNCHMQNEFRNFNDLLETQRLHQQIVIRRFFKTLAVHYKQYESDEYDYDLRDISKFPYSFD